MTQSKHTPAPWATNGRYIETEDVICEMFGEDRSIRDANARLIASAPDLLDALEKFEAAFGAQIDGGCDVDANDAEGWIRIARAAIAKAKGE